jgi:uncharacterized repeat protein (TIGR03943 family)
MADMRDGAPRWEGSSAAPRRLSPAELATAALLLGTVALLAATLVQETLDLYVNGVLRPLVFFSLAVLGLQLVALAARGGAATCQQPGCHGAEPAAAALSRRQQLSLMVLAIPILLGLVVPPQVLGSAAIGARDIASVAATGTASNAQDAATFDMSQAYEPAGDEPDPLKRNVLQWRRVMSATHDPVAALAGQPVDLVGFVYFGPGDGADRFTVARYVIRCCVADANPMGLPVHTAQAGSLKPDTWVRVRGVLAAGTANGQPALVIEPQRVEPVAQPLTPYINGLS